MPTAPDRFRPDQLSSMLGRWVEGHRTLADELVAGMERLIEAGLLPPGARMPPQRGLAEALGVSRGIVTSAYDTLEARGLFASQQGSGSRVTSARSHVLARSGGRLFSFTDVPPDVTDLSTGALPASRVAQEVLHSGVAASSLGPYLSTDGYFPAGLPVLRAAVAARLTADGLPTRQGQILITAGAQQATWLTITSLAGSGELVVVEEPTYRGALEVIREVGARIRSVPIRPGGVDLDMFAAAVGQRPALVYCQTGVHNPTGIGTSPRTRAAMADIVNRAGVVVIDDQSSADLHYQDSVAAGLAGAVEPELLITLGSLSKLFWGGLRVGWIRAGEDRIRALSEVLKPASLSASVIDQLNAAEMVHRTDEAREERRHLLTTALVLTENAVSEAFPEWTWTEAVGGSGLWVDAHTDTVALSERAKRLKIKLAPGPGFSPDGAQRSMLRVPIWHEVDVLNTSLDRLRRPLAAEPTNPVQ